MNDKYIDFKWGNVYVSELGNILRIEGKIYQKIDNVTGECYKCDLCTDDYNSETCKLEELDPDYYSDCTGRYELLPASEIIKGLL